MTPKEKVEELLNKYRFGKPCSFIDRESNEIEFAKQCALIAVDELIHLQGQYNHGNPFPSNYWKEVKQEIEKL